MKPASLEERLVRALKDMCDACDGLSSLYVTANLDSAQRRAEVLLDAPECKALFRRDREDYYRREFAELEARRKAELGE